MRMYVKLFLSVIIFIFTSSTLFSQTVIKYPLQDSGTEIGAGIAVRLNSSGQIVLCDSNDVNIVGIIQEKENVSGTIYYNVVNSDATEAFLRAGVSIGDKLTVAAGGTLKVLQPSEMIVGYALEDGPASGVAQRRKIMITLDATLTGNFIWNQDTSAQLGNYWISGDSKTDANDSIGGNLTVEGAAVINDGGGVNDFRVEGFTDQNLIFTDAANDWLGIGTDAPTAKLDVNGQTRIRTIPSGLTTDSILTVDANGNIRSINFNQLEDDDWSRNNNYVYTYNTSDSIGVGLTSPDNKLDIDGGVLMHGNRYWGVDPSGSDSFWIYDDGDTTFFNADNPIKIGDLSLILETDGDARITKHLYIETVDEDSITDSVLVLASGGRVSWASKEMLTSGSTSGYAEIYIGDTLGKAVLLPATSAWTTMDSASSGEVVGSPYITTHTALGVDSIVIGTDGESIYQINISISLSGPAKLEFRLGLFLDDSLLQEFIVYSTTGVADGIQSVSVSGLLPLQTNDVLTLKMKNQYSTTAKTIVIYNFCLQLTQIEF